MKHMLMSVCCMLVAAVAQAESGLDVQKVAENTFAIVGPFDQRNPENLGNNATFGLVVTKEGAVLIDAGGSYNGAKALHAVIRSVTDQPIVYVINTGGQDHRWIGNGYWKEQGATIIASAAAVADQNERASLQQTLLSNLIGDKLNGTEPVFADVTFESDHVVEIGGRALVLRHRGAAHTPGDCFVWLEDVSTVFTGDIVFVGRILGIGTFSSALEWLGTFDAFASLNPTHVVPGHGPATDLATATRDTRDYIANLREKIGEHIDEGGDIIDSVKVDQSAFSYLVNFDGLAGRNAQEVYGQMEWE